MNTVIPATCYVELPQFACAQCIETAVRKKVSMQSHNEPKFTQKLDSMCVTVLTGLFCLTYVLLVLAGTMTKREKTSARLERVNQYHRIVHATARMLVSYEQALEMKQKGQQNYPLLRSSTLNQLNKLSVLATKVGTKDKIAEIVLRNVDEIRTSMLDQRPINTLNFATELNDAITALLDNDRRLITPWWNSLYTVLIFAVVLWLL